MNSVPVRLTFRDRTDMEVLTKEGTAGLRRHKILRMAHESVDQGGLLTQEDLAVLLCSFRRTIRRDMKALKEQGNDVPTRGTLQDIGPGVTHRSKVVKMWLEGIPDFGQEEFQRSRNIMTSCHSPLLARLDLDGLRLLGQLQLCLHAQGSLHGILMQVP